MVSLKAHHWLMHEQAPADTYQMDTQAMGEILYTHAALPRHSLVRSEFLYRTAHCIFYEVKHCVIKYMWFDYGWVNLTVLVTLN